MKLYNTEKREKETIEKPEGRPLLMYTCGPTVYNFAHIGNFRTYVFEDLLRRSLLHLGYPLKHVMNLTDVDDKTIKGANAENKSLNDYSQTYIDAFFEDLDTLHIQRVEAYPKATDHIPDMIDMIQTLLDKGIAYQGNEGNVFYSISHFPSYGRLAHLKLDDLKTGASERVTLDEYEKDTPMDFVLWKAYVPERDGEIYWDSPFGKGRPGWHIECSAMALKLLGESIDIHVGGVDNMFPHHENEIAQSEACTGKHFVKHWLHSEHLLVDGKKMSKSLGNFYTLRDLLDKGYTGEEVRYLLLQTHYRTQLNFTLEGLDAARNSLQRIADFVYRLKNTQGSDSLLTAPLIHETQAKFKAALEDDLNISQALAALFDFIREINLLLDSNKVGPKEAQDILTFLTSVDEVLGVLPLEEKSLDIPANILEAFEKRQAARAEKNWAEADAMRDLITAAGYLIEDTPTGPRLKRSS